jgi:hypothetical protein
LSGGTDFGNVSVFAGTLDIPLGADVAVDVGLSISLVGRGDTN